MEEKEITDFVKAVAEADRLRIVGLLTQTPARLSEINTVLGLHPSDTRRHLDQLIQSGVVRLSAGLYQLDIKALERLSRQQFEGERASYTPEPELEKNKRRVLAAHLNPDGTIKIIPLQPAKLHVILDYLINAFTVGANYTDRTYASVI
jgi:DNA-binding transcriptional ArsR family regulator